MNKLEAWTITICIVMAMLAIPSWVYRWALLVTLGAATNRLRRT
jgi:hypothetical protein